MARSGGTLPKKLHLEYTNHMILKLLGHSANDLYWFILPLVLPLLLVRYELSYAGAGGILSVYLFVAAIGSFMLGKLSDRLSSRRILSSGFLLASLGLIAAGFAPNLTIFLLLMSVTAVGVSTFHPVMYAILDLDYPESKGKVMGLYESFGIGAILLMYLINGYLLKWIGIRGVLILTAVPGLAIGLLYLSPSRFPISARKLAAMTANPDAAGRKALFRFAVFLSSVILRAMGVTAFLNFLPTIFASFLGLGGNTAAYGTAFYFAGAILGSLTAGKLFDRLNPLAVLVLGSSMIVLSILVLSLSLPLWIYPCVITILGFSAAGCVINQNLLMTRLGKHLGKGEVFGILMGVITLTSAVSPALFGLLIDFAGFRTALRILSLPLVFSIMILIVMLRTDRFSRSNPVEAP